MTGAQTRVSGLREVTSKLKMLDGTAPAEVKLLNRGAAELAVPVIRALVPIGNQPNDPHPGLLASSIRAGASQRSGYVAAGSAKVPYAAPRNFGWPAHHIDAALFMQRGALHAEPAITAEYARGLTSLIRRVGL